MNKLLSSIQYGVKRIGLVKVKEIENESLQRGVKKLVISKGNLRTG